VCLSVLPSLPTSLGYGVFRKSDYQVRSFELIRGDWPRMKRGIASRFAAHIYITTSPVNGYLLPDCFDGILHRATKMWAVPPVQQEPELTDRQRKIISGLKRDMQQEP